MIFKYLPFVSFINWDREIKLNQLDELNIKIFKTPWFLTAHSTKMLAIILLTSIFFSIMYMCG